MLELVSTIKHPAMQIEVTWLVFPQRARHEARLISHKITSQLFRSVTAIDTAAAVFGGVASACVTVGPCPNLTSLRLGNLCW